MSELLVIGLKNFQLEVFPLTDHFAEPKLLTDIMIA